MGRIAYIGFVACADYSASDYRAVIATEDEWAELLADVPLKEGSPRGRLGARKVNGSSEKRLMRTSKQNWRTRARRSRRRLNRKSFLSATSSQRRHVGPENEVDDDVLRCSVGYWNASPSASAPRAVLTPPVVRRSGPRDRRSPRGVKTPLAGTALSCASPKDLRRA